jgi:hypothetical protein
MVDDEDDGRMKIMYMGKVSSIYTSTPLHAINTNQGVDWHPSSKSIAHLRNQRTMRKAPPIALDGQHPLPTVVLTEANLPDWDWPHHHLRKH